MTAWLDRSKRDLRMARKIDGNAPSAISKPREDMSISVPAIPTPAGMDEPDANTGEAYIRKSDGTPKLKRSMNFVNIPLNEEEEAQPLEEVQIANPKYISDEDWEDLHIWVHDWFLQRIPEKHQHLVSDVNEGDIDGLLVKVFGLAARNPMEYCRTIKTKMKKSTLTVTNFDLVAHQWLLDQYELFDTINEANCIGEYKMAPTDFVDHIIDTLEPFLPSLARTYRDSVIDDRT